MTKDLKKERAEKTDGFGDPIKDDGIYYVQDKRTIVGNCILFWCPAGAGYTCELDNAGTYLGSDVRNMRKTDIPWPYEAVQAAKQVHVRLDRLYDAKVFVTQTGDEAKEK